VDLQLEPPAPPTPSRTRWAPVIAGALLAVVLAAVLFARR